MNKNRTFQKKILLTFDYELFFKRSGTLKNCIIKPVDTLIQCFNHYNVKATFFVDILYYLRMVENNQTREQSKLVKSQLQELVANGHRIELHLHSHWLDAKYINGEWIFPTYRYYRLQNLSEEKIIDLMVTGSQVLNEIAREVESEYRVIAFRAGGWCIQPFDKLKTGFLKSGIRVDSSVAAKMKGESQVHSFDFDLVPLLEQYKFSDNPVCKDNKGQFLQIPITTYRISPSEKIYRKLEEKINHNKYRKYGDGIGIDMANNRRRWTACYEMFTLDRMSPYLMKKKLKDTNTELICFISHPKALTQRSLDCIEFLHELNCNFIHIKQVL